MQEVLFCTIFVVGCYVFNVLCDNFLLSTAEKDYIRPAALCQITNTLFLTLCAELTAPITLPIRTYLLATTLRCHIQRLRILTAFTKLRKIGRCCFTICFLTIRFHSNLSIFVLANRFSMCRNVLNHFRSGSEV